MPLFPLVLVILNLHKRKEIARVTLFLRTSPFQADCESIIAGCKQKIMVMPKLFCGPLRVVCVVKTPHVRLACALRFGQFLPVDKHVEARTAGCKRAFSLLISMFDDHLCIKKKDCSTYFRMISSAEREPCYESFMW
jgi:hypothetical protein